ncbi:hypothetical protein [Bacillus cereus]|nr:hypothetical protein [Bacillus cereus]
MLQSVMHTLKGVKQRVECSIGSVTGVIERQQERKVTKRLLT